MYKSPIDIFYGQIETRIEGEIMKAVQKVHVNVDEDELLRALQYDRGQYKKGYDDAISELEAKSKWIPVTEQEEPTENGTYLCHGYWFGSRRKQTETADFFGEWNIANNFILTHWMPLLEAPKGE